MPLPGLILGAFLALKWIPYATLGALGDTSGSKKAPKDAQGLILVDLGCHFGSVWCPLGVNFGPFGADLGAIFVDLGVILVHLGFMLFHLGLFV